MMEDGTENRDKRIIDMARIGNRRKYPWEEWFSRARTELVRGTDYEVSQSIMYQTIRNNAWQRAIRVNITDTGHSMIIEVVGRTDAIPHPDQATVANE